MVYLKQSIYLSYQNLMYPRQFISLNYTNLISKAINIVKLSESGLYKIITIITPSTSDISKAINNTIWNTLADLHYSPSSKKYVFLLFWPFDLLTHFTVIWQGSNICLFPIRSNKFKGNSLLVNSQSLTWFFFTPNFPYKYVLSFRKQKKFWLRKWTEEW